MKRLIPAIPLAAALAVLFTVPAYADVMYSPAEEFALRFGIFGIIAIALVLGFICLSVAAVLIIIFVRRARAKKKEEQK